MIKNGQKKKKSYKKQGFGGGAAIPKGERTALVSLLAGYIVLQNHDY